MRKPEPCLETERLLIRNWEPDDWRLVQPMASNPLVMQYIGHYHPWQEAETRQFVLNRIRDYEQYGWTMWPLLLKESGEFIGYCGYLRRRYGEYEGEVEIGYAINRSHWGQGLTAEAGARILDYGFETLGFDRVIASARQENAASIRVMQKLGMMSIGDSPNDRAIPRPHYSIENPHR
jgi:ribosomal-protein-alanine N-acetyltransferase